ncbi:MAG: selenide, water dikinase SelD [bacterium]|nr:selenide, water dikinase SelD [bacterium]
MKAIYLDYNATTPIAPEVAEAMLPYLQEHFGNPSSSHCYGVQTKKAIELARKQVANLLHCEPDEIVFTSGGSEANNYAIKGYAFANQNRGDHIITSQIEHPAVLEVCRYLERQGFSVSYVPVDEYGMVDVDTIRKEITLQTILITIMHANNEVGTIQPIAEIAETAKQYGIAMHSDAAQSMGKILVQVDRLGVDLLSVAGHKLYAPKGIGALYLRHGVQMEKFMHGADHERNHRAGTENVLEIVGLGKACEIAQRDLKTNMAHSKAMRDRLHEGITAQIDRVKLNGHPERRLPNTLSLSFQGIEANTMLSELEDVAASAGAACHSGDIDVSAVLSAMKVPLDYAMGTIRLSTGCMTTEEEVDRAVSRVVETAKRLRPELKETLDVSVDPKEIKLTHFTHGLGCACKLRPQVLEQVLTAFPASQDGNVLVGTETADDAAVYRIDEQTALVQTVDFFTPIVDDPYHFGAIAAVNSLSDIYAMGGKPLFALNIVGFPSNRLPFEVLQEILRGARDKAREAGISIIGGHTIDDTEPKYGLAVSGIVHPDRILKNSGAKAGDAIIITKALGTGIISTAMKRGLADQAAIDGVTMLMGTLNRAAAEVLQDFDVHACTDVTGFGLLGHLKEMARASGMDAIVHHEEVPVLEPARDFAAGGVIPGGTMANLDFVSDVVHWEQTISESCKYLLADAQTSGGLLFALPAAQKDAVLKSLRERHVPQAACIGEFTQPGEGKIFVR